MNHIEIMKELLEIVDTAIKSGDWVVDGACDPDRAIQRCYQALAEAEKDENEIIELAMQGHSSTRDAIRWAMNQEREACAQIADKCAEQIIEHNFSMLIAHQIRARGQA